MIRHFLISSLLILGCAASNAQTETEVAGSYAEEPEQRKKIIMLLDLASERLEREPVLATEELLEARERAFAYGDSSLAASAINMLGNIRYYASDSPGAMVHWKNALNLAVAINDSSLIGLLYNNVGNAYQDINLDSCIYYYHLSLDVTLKMGDTLQSGEMLINLANLYYDDTLVLELSERYTEEAKMIFQRNGDEDGILSCDLQMSRILTEKGFTTQSIPLALTSLETAHRIKSKYNEEMALDAVRLAYKKAGKHDLAYAYSDSLLEFIYELEEAKILSLVAEMEKQQELSVKEDQISQLEADNSRSEKANTRQKTVIATSIIGIVLLFFLGYKMVQEKKRSDELLLNILPFEVAEELKATGKAKARKYDSVTVIFTDFKDFSKISEQVSAEELVEMIDEHFSAFDRVIDTYGLEKIKTIGDSYMAAGGIPVSNEDHAEKTVQAALEM